MWVQSGWRADGEPVKSGRLQKSRSTRGCLRRAGLAVFLVTTASLACSSFPPVRAIRAARYYAAGTRALERGDDAVAIAELERAVALMPNASEIHNHLGLAYWSDGRERAAERELSRALELDCDNGAARANLARLRDVRAAAEAEKRSASNGG